MGQTSGAHTQGKKLRRFDGNGQRARVQLYGAGSSAAWGLQSNKGSMALSGRKFPALDRQMSSRITAPAHTVGAWYFQRPRGPSASGDGLIERANCGQAKRDVSELDEPHKPRTNAGVAVEVDSRNNGLGPNILGQICGRNAGWRQVQRQSLPFGPRKAFWTLAGAVGQWLCKTAAGRSVARRPAVRATESKVLEDDAQNYTLEEPGSPAGKPSQTLDSHPTAAACTDVP